MKKLSALMLVLAGLMTTPAMAQDSTDVAATNSKMYAAIAKINFSSDNTTGVGPITSAMPLMTINISNDSDYELFIKTFSVTFSVSGEVTAWPSINGSERAYHMVFVVPQGQSVIMTFPVAGYHPIAPHSTARLDLFAIIPDAPKRTLTCATTFTQVEYLLGSWMGIMTPNVYCRNWKVQ